MPDMSVNGQFPAQLIAMVSADTKARIRAEAESRDVSISQVVRERLADTPVKVEVGKSVLVDETINLTKRPKREFWG